MTMDGHREAQLFASRATLRVHEGDHGGAQELFSQAADLEIRALEGFSLAKRRTWGILAVSAAALLYKARRYAEAERLLAGALSHDELAPDLLNQLRELLSTVRLNLEALVIVDGRRHDTRSASRTVSALRVGHQELPPWLSVHTRRVLQPFVRTLARAHRWSVLYIVSPWISRFDEEAGMSFEQMIKRLTDDNATAYIVTRRPVDHWHEQAVDALAQSGQANIRFVEGLHTKLYCARTAKSDFALLGSANLTQRSLENLELGMLVQSYGAGAPTVRALTLEAAAIYQSSEGKLFCKRQLRRRGT